MISIKKFLIIIVALVINDTCLGQSGDTILMTEVIQQMKKETKKSYYLEDQVILYDLYSSEVPVEDHDYFSVEDRPISDLDLCHLNYIGFTRCTFLFDYFKSSHIVWKNVIGNNLDFTDCNAAEFSSVYGVRYKLRGLGCFPPKMMMFFGCDFSSITIRGFNGCWAFKLDSNVINDLLISTIDSVYSISIKNLWIDHKIFDKRESHNDGRLSLELLECNKVELDHIRGRDRSQELRLRESMIDELEIRSVSLHTLRFDESLLGKLNIKNFTISSSAFDTIDFHSGQISESINTIGELLIDHWHFGNISLPYGAMDLPWKYLGNKNISLQHLKHPSTDKQANQGFQYSSEHEYREAMAFYRDWINNYSKRGDTESRNACLVDLRSIETNRLKEKYVETREFKHWFAWNFNEFLKLFSDFGTNPLRALQFSGYTILFFSGIYFVIPMVWGQNNDLKLSQLFTLSSLYFSSRISLLEFIQNPNKAKINRFKEFDLYLTDQDIPKPVRWQLKQLFKALVFWNQASLLLTTKMGLLKWIDNDIRAKPKWILSIVYTLTLIIYVLFFLILRYVNAMMISLNSFSTLGFGGLHVEGLAKYFALIQGLVGWLMLSLFSVSLISQMVQA